MTSTERFTVIGAIFTGVGLGFGGYHAGLSNKDSAELQHYESRLEQAASNLERALSARAAAEAEANALRSENQELRNRIAPAADDYSERSPDPAPSPDAEAAATPQARPSSCTNNRTFQCAIPLEIGASDSDVFDGGERYYRFNVREAGPVSFTLNPMPETRWVAVTIFDAQYNRVGFKRFEKGQPGSFSLNVRQPGQYFAKLYPSACCSGAPYNFTFGVSR